MEDTEVSASIPYYFKHFVCCLKSLSIAGIIQRGNV